MKPFRDRSDAGRKLARELSRYAERRDVLVFALPRGGVPVAFEVAQALRVPLDVFMVRKLGVPGHEELAMGALAGGGVRVLNEDVLQSLQIPPATLEAVVADEQRELERRNRLYRDGRPATEVQGRTIILVDDGLATGASMRAAVAALRRQRPARIVVAVPVASIPTCREFKSLVDELVCLDTPEPFHAVGIWYEDFSQTTDQQVRDLLERASRRQSPSPPPGNAEPVSRTVHVTIGKTHLVGNLDIPPEARAIVLFAHGSGSSRHSPRNQFVAESLRRRGLATLLVDLLTPQEEIDDRREGHLRFDIPLLADRLSAATDWILADAATRNLRIGFFGASTGAAAALMAAAQRPNDVVAIVSRGGRPDLARAHLREVRTATLLIVGENDEPVIEFNQHAAEQLSRAIAKELRIVPLATHLFEEPGTLEEVARLAADWFSRYLGPPSPPL